MGLQNGERTVLRWWIEFQQMLNYLCLNWFNPKHIVTPFYAMPTCEY